ncbi:hypothetical protein OM076_32340 [Solirubrobacter ginsenosidimutans]|uniref:Uncharacterized protein n=1 Tax=Solirubrobacter ginsenosidimutans TaxID=490573 RepID=A0A9X3N0V8_9ACTN|nr:hypothetical protein [Solirubrobacter ginsenosidimutans]MDA0165003.1 hypothetical protein [Solirubrobacter ginsenosidimutans]
MHTDFSARRVLVTEYVEGLRADEMTRLAARSATASARSPSASTSASCATSKRTNLDGEREITRAPAVLRVDAPRRNAAPTLLLRRRELQMLALLGELHAGADWGPITAEHHSDVLPSTVLGREDHAFFVTHTR